MARFDNSLDRAFSGCPTSGNRQTLGRFCYMFCSRDIASPNYFPRLPTQAGILILCTNLRAD
jgi:hypothetical protein